MRMRIPDDRLTEVPMEVAQGRRCEPVMAPPIRRPHHHEEVDEEAGSHRAADTGADASTLGSETKFTARIGSDYRAKPGDRVRLAVDCGKFHFFDPESGYRVGAARA